jgi:hypothetical protein
MAYGVKYQLLCVGKNGVTSKTVISEDGYAGAEIDRNIPVNPFRLRKDAAGVICGTSLEFGIREAVDFEFLQFYTNNPKKYKVEFYYPSTTLIWSGYINPQQYDANYVPSPSTLFFQATDGLGLLKDEPFTLTGFNSELTIIRHCLDKIGLGIGYAIAINMWETEQDRTRTPLAQTYIDSVVFSGKNCYEVIEAILGNGKYDATITQWNNKWRIVSYKDKKSTRLLYSSAGVYDTTEAAPGVPDLGQLNTAGTDVYPIGTLRMGLQSGGKKVKITHNYGRKLSLLDGYDFNLYASSMFTYWTKGGTFTVSQRKTKDDKYYAWLASYSNVDTDYIEQDIPITNVVNEDFVFEIDVAACGFMFTAYTGQTPVSMAVRMLISLTVGATVYYLTDTGWDTTLAYLTVTLTSCVGAVEFSTIKVITDEIPGSGTLNVRLMRYKSSGPGASTTYKGIAYTNALVYFLKDDQLYTDKFEDTANFDLSSEPAKMDDMTVLAADAPDLVNNSQLYVNITRLSNRVPTLTWNMEGNDTDLSLLYAFVKMLASRNIYPRQKLTGTIKGTGIGFECLIKHAYNSDREFEIYECTWDVYENKWGVTLLEWFAWSDQHVTFDSGVILHSAANLTVYSVTPADFTLAQEEVFNTTVHVDNTGESTGRQLIEWKIVDGSDNTISSGTHVSGAIAASGHEDHVIALNAPYDPDTYYVKCRIATDTNWVSSAAITVYTELSGSITNQDNVSVYGGSDGSVTVEGSGGVPAYEYKLGGGSYQSGGTFSGLTADNYTVTVRDTNLDTHDVSVTITQPARPVIEVESAALFLAWEVLSYSDYDTIDATQGPRALTLTKISTGDGTTWASVSPGTGETAFDFRCRAQSSNTSGYTRSMIIRISDDASLAEDVDVTLTQSFQPA